MPEVAKLTLRQAAEDDLEEIDRFSAERFGKAVADGYAQGLVSALDAVAELPYAAPLREDFGAGVRGKLYRSHRVLYRIEEDGEVVVLRVLHHSRDIRPALNL